MAVENEENSGIPVGHVHMGKELKGKTRILADFIGGCETERLYYCIEPIGIIQPCVFMPVQLRKFDHNKDKVE